MARYEGHSHQRQEHGKTRRSASPPSYQRRPARCCRPFGDRPMRPRGARVRRRARWRRMCVLRTPRDDATPTSSQRLRSCDVRHVLVERRSHVLCRRVMHGSEIQAKYGNGAWQNMYVWVCGKYYAPRKIPRTPQFEWVRIGIRMGVNRSTFRVHTHRVVLHAEQDMSKRPAPPTAAAGAADAGAADDRSSRNPDGAIECRGGRFDCRMCAHESFGVKK